MDGTRQRWTSTGAEELLARCDEIDQAPAGWCLDPQLSTSEIRALLLGVHDLGESAVS